jgi:ADP-ribose pyrophosphatase YjhB (NUDIX family)
MLSKQVENSTKDVGAPHDAGTEELDGLLVVPDVKEISSVYLCLGTGRDEFRRDHLASEHKLKDEIFAQSSPPVDTANPSFKVSCAICLLEIEPNGFVCVSSSSRQTVDFVRDLARKRAEQKRKEGALHADHAHYICTVPRRILWQLCDKARTREQKRQATKELMELYLGRQGVPTHTTNICEQIEMGHHLLSLLLITKDDSDADNAHWMILVYDNTSNRTNPSWTLDLPGGKRHLGERSFEGAVRETEEESSLQLDGQWMLDDGPRRHSRKDDISHDYYYMMGPPSDLLMGAVTDKPFWQNPGFCKDPES